MARGQQGLAGTRRTDHQHAAGDLAAEPLEFARVAQELDHLGDLLLGLLDTGDVGEGDLDLVLAEHAGAALAEGHRAPAAGAALHLAHEKDPHADQQQHREPGDEDLHQQGLLIRRLYLDLDVVVQQVIHHLRIFGRRLGDEAAAVGTHAFNGVVLDFHALHVALLDLGDEFRIVDVLRAGLGGPEIIEDRHQYDGDDDPQNQIFYEIIQTGYLNMAVRALP